MSAHSHREVVPGCYRCELSQDEARHALLDEAEQWARGHPNRRSGELMSALVARVRRAEGVITEVKAAYESTIHPEQNPERCGVCRIERLLSRCEKGATQ